MKQWTKKQYKERARIMKESDFPLMGSKPGQGYFGSREMLADLHADTYYEWQKTLKKIKKDIEDME